LLRGNLGRGRYNLCFAAGKGRVTSKYGNRKERLAAALRENLRRRKQAHSGADRNDKAGDRSTAAAAPEACPKGAVKQH